MNKEILSFLMTVLEKYGYDVYPAHSPVEGLRLGNLTPPDLVILDVMMPEAGGLNYYERFRTIVGKDKPIPILIYSGAPTFLIHGKVEGMAKEDVVSKTENIDVLVKAIEARIGKP